MLYWLMIFIIAHRFGVSRATVYPIFTTWISFILFMASRQQINDFMLHPFKDIHPTTRYITVAIPDAQFFGSISQSGGDSNSYG